MYEDSWYTFVPDISQRPGAPNTSSPSHRRKESLLQQPNGTLQQIGVDEPLNEIFEQIENQNTPPEAEVIRRTKSYSSIHAVPRQQRTKDVATKKRRREKERSWEALMLPGDVPHAEEVKEFALDAYDEALLEASQQEYLLYQDQLALTERHLDTLIEDANAGLNLLTNLSNSFKSVESQTTSFRAQCEDLLSEQIRLQKLADEVGTDLYYYTYLDNVTRRLNAPGAGRLVDDNQFRDVMWNLDACIQFMANHPSYRDSESYLARYQALLTKALHLLEVGFNNRLEKVSSEIAKQIAATQSESARHALAYGRFEETLLDSYSLIPNIQRVVRSVYDQVGNPVQGVASYIYVNTANNLFHSYMAIRDRDLKPITQHDVDELKSESKSLSPETASRNFVKQCFERAYNEANLFAKIFRIELQWNTDEASAFMILKGQQRSLVNPANLTPLATNLQAILQQAELKTVCAVVGWLAHEYLLLDYDNDESPFVRQCRELSARLLTEHLWPFTDTAFEAELTKTISKTVINNADLKIGPVVGGVSSSNAYPPVKKALQLLALFDQSMPKERSQQNSAVVFKIVRETIQVLQRAEAKIKGSAIDTDSDLFIVKNLLILKNELVSLEIGDIRSHAASMQHFSQIWDTLSPQNWMGFIGNIIGWGRGGEGARQSVTAKTLTVEDMNEQLDELLRLSIYAFTQRWGKILNDARARKGGAKPLGKVERELDDLLGMAFSNQPEVVGKLKEAIEIGVQAHKDADGEKGVRRY